MHNRSHHRQSVWKGAVAGLAAGLGAAWVMNQFQAALTRATQPTRAPSRQSDEDTTMKAAEAIAEHVGDRRLSRHEKQIAGPALHYVVGSGFGALYGVLAECAPATARGWGLPFGAALWLAADEIAVPAFGLSKPPREYPASVHASALANHLVYGAATDLLRRAIRAI